MKKIFLLFLFLFIILNVYASNNVPITSLWITAFLTATIHTIMGPDHYLPFIAIAKSRNYSLKKTLLWTFICGIGHILSALILAIIFVYFTSLLSETKFNWIEKNRGDFAAYLLVILGLLYFIWALRHRYLHKKWVEHHHHLINLGENKNITIWVMFIIFILGPCEALLPILTASSVIGFYAVISSTIIFSISTIVTMLLMVYCGMLGIELLKINKLENYAHEIAGATIMLCGIGILFGL